MVLTNMNLVDDLVKYLPSNLLDQLKALSREDFEKVLQLTAGTNDQKEKENKCGICGKSYHSAKNLWRHRRTHTDKFECKICGYVTNRKDNLKRHDRLRKTLHERIQAENGTSAKTTPVNNRKRNTADREEIDDDDDDDRSKKRKRGNEEEETVPVIDVVDDNGSSGNVEDESEDTQRSSSSVDVEQREDEENIPPITPTTTSIQGNVNVFDFFPKTEEEKYDLICFLREKQGQVKRILEERLVFSNIKFYLNVNVKMIKFSLDNTYEEQHPYFQSSTKTVLRSNKEDIQTMLNACHQKIFTSLEEFLKNGSGFQLDQVKKMELTVIKYNPFQQVAGSFIDLPLTVKRTNSLLNIVNSDDMCLVWSVLASIHPVEENKQPELTNHYLPFVDELKLDGMNFPTPLSQIRKFESMNEGISINVFGLDGDIDIFPLFITEKTNCHHVNLLFIAKEDRTHFVLIKNFNRFLSRTKSHASMLFFCYHCLNGFKSEDQLQRHRESCSKFNSQRISLPKEGEVIEFKEYEKIHRHPFVIYADFECYNRKISFEESSTTTTTTSSIKHQEMEAYSFGYQRVSVDERFQKEPVIYRGSNVIEKFLECMIEEEAELIEILNRNEPMVVNDFVKEEYNRAVTCYVCKNPFNNNKNRKVIDHDHLTGEVRGIACNKCNLKMKTPTFIPVVFHNLKGFDSHLIMSAIGKYKERRIRVIPMNKEKYLSFSFGKMRFIDSLQFLNDSLATLTRNLAQEGEQHFQYLRQSFPNPEHFNLLLRKGVFPYDYVDCEEKLKETCLPSKEKFYNRLTDQHISEEDYQFARLVWEKMNVATIGGYSDVYLKMDVVLLADIFERFRDVCLKEYELDPCFYFTSPGFSWSAMLKKTGAVLDLISDIDMLLFFEKAIRGGVSSIIHRYAKANNRYMGKEYNEEEESSYLLYLDANNLYGWAMNQPLPYGFFEWETNDENIDLLMKNIFSISTFSSHGYAFEVDLEYPHDLHDDHSDFPLAPEGKTVSTDALSPYCREMLNDILQRNTIGSSNRKLIPNLYDKEKYVLHYRNLQLYLQLGMKVKKVHRVLKFKQSTWLKSYIDFNTEKRKQAKNDFEKSLYKLLNNSIFGRSLMNTRKHVDVKLCQSENSLQKYTSRPSFKSCVIFNEDLVAVENIRTNVLINHPIYVGFTILDLSKHLMYDFHYNQMKKIYVGEDKLKLCFTDTDSFLYHIITKDVYMDIKRHQHLFDTSDYAENHFLHSKENKKVLGKFKDETNGKVIKEFVGLRSKMYSFLYDDDKEKHTAKGVTKASSRKLKHEMYKDSLFQKKTFSSCMYTIRSEKHHLFCQSFIKKTLVPFDDKRWILSDGYSTRAYGHKFNIIE